MPSHLLVVETNLTTELVSLIDGRLEDLFTKYGDPEYADLLGTYDSMEHLTGLGFVACQTYITAAYGILNVPKAGALSVGPDHSAGRTVVSIVNAAANYWKHYNEWHFDKSPKRRIAIEEAFEDVGFPVGTEYPLSGILAELSVPAAASFAAVMRLLENWKSRLAQESSNISLQADRER
jgi:hypothetical protein